MKVSIITPVYNRVDCIAKCMSSVAGQTYTNIEHILIDGVSKDGTLDVIKKNLNSRTFFFSAPDKGIFDALNKGLKKSSGNIISVLNSDDYFANENIISEVVNIFLETGCEIIYGDVGFFKSKDFKVVRRFNSGFFTPDKLQYGFQPAHPAMFINKSIYDEYGGYETGFKIAGDFEFIARIFSTRKISSFYFKKILIHMRSGGVSTSFNLKSKILLNREILLACRKNGVKTNLIKILYRYFFKISEYFRL